MGVLAKVGRTGKGTHYVLNRKGLKGIRDTKRLILRNKPAPDSASHERAIKEKGAKHLPRRLSLLVADRSATFFLKVRVLLY